ncbi:MAG: hypothetical protein MR727_06740, partial [Lentisphaeria bacterium]|nr:hypothetical protein [Lentisphaeria bacterium]
MDKILYTDHLSNFLVEELNTRIEQIENKLQILKSQIDAIMSLESQYDDEYYQAGMAFVQQMTKVADLLTLE